MSIVARVGVAMQELFRNRAQAAAETSGIIRRKRKFTAGTLAQTFVLGLLGSPKTRVILGVLAVFEVFGPWRTRLYIESSPNLQSGSQSARTCFDSGYSGVGQHGRRRRLPGGENFEVTFGSPEDVIIKKMEY